MIDEKGRCCGKRPLVYKREAHLYCSRCDRAYDLDDPHDQIDNWAWKKDKAGVFVTQLSGKARESAAHGGAKE